MKVVKPNWVEHAAGEKKTKSPIYSLSVHPDGTRLATGGQDNKVKIWSTLPILDAEAQENELNHKLLCTMSAHTGPVLTVRWAHHGRYLASGSDDSVLLIWDIDPAGGGRVFGSEEVNVENWKALRRLVGHVADVVDCAWSRDDSMLASVGLDSKIFIWDGYTFERLRTIDTHGGFVKGVTWDPVGNYLATQSDDKTVRIWDTDTWKEVVLVEEPFKMSPQSTFFRRLSWSPDGAFIAASNAMNGPVFVAAVIEREGWSADISFVGHQNTIQIAAFNPRLFFGRGQAHTRINASCMVALGADDFTISIWRNTLFKPLAVIRDIFGRQILDLCWSNDGLCLYGCSADGTIAAIQFRPDEFPDIAEPEATTDVLKQYGYKPKRSRPAPQVQRLLTAASSDFSAAPVGASEQVNIIIPRKAKPKARRVNLSGTMTGNATPNGIPPSRTQSSHGGRAPLARPVEVEEPRGGRGGAADAFAAAVDEPLSETSASAATARMLQAARMAFDSDSARTGDKRRAADDDTPPSRGPRGRTMGTQNAVGTVREIRAPRVVLGASAGSAHVLPVPAIQTVLRAQNADGTGVMTAENAANDRGTHTLSFTLNGKDAWVDFIPSSALALAVGSSFAAVAAEDATVRIYSHTGRHLSGFKLPAPVSELAAAGDMLMAITAECMARVIDTRSHKTVLAPTSVSHLLDPPSSSNSTAHTVTEAFVRPNGCAVVVTSEPTAWGWDPDVCAWTQLVSGWWAASPLHEGRSRSSSRDRNGPLADLEQRVAARATPPARKPQWWDEALALGDFETRLRATRLLGSKDEYKHWLREYAKYLAQESFRDRAEELVQELMGPVYYLPKQPKWEPKLMGMSKRNELAPLALNQMKTSAALGTYAADQLALLKRIGAGEVEWLGEK